jgi:hypothetical protein
METVTPSGLEKKLRRVCGTWTLKEFVAYLKTTNLTKTDCIKAIDNFKHGEKLLSEMCQTECYGCSYHVLEHMKLSSCQRVVKQYNEEFFMELQGGGKKTALDRALRKQKEKAKDCKGDSCCPICRTDAKENNKIKGPAIPLHTTNKGCKLLYHRECIMEWISKSGSYACPTCKQTITNEMALPPITKDNSIDTIEDCPEYDEKTQQVHDTDLMTGKQLATYVDTKDVLGYGRHELSDKHCYSQKKLRKFVESHAVEAKKRFTKDDLELIKGPMLEDEQTVVMSLTQRVVAYFTTKLEEWQDSLKTKAKAARPLTSYKTELIAGVAGMALAFATGGMSVLVGGVVGVLAANKAVRDFVMEKSINLTVWIIKDPKTSMMFLMMIKVFIRSCCREMARVMMQSSYEAETKTQSLVGSIKNTLGNVKDGFSMSAISKAVLNGDNWKRMWDDGGQYVATGIATAIAGPAGGLAASGIKALVSGAIDCAKEASQMGIELACYQSDIQKGTRMVGEILQMVLNPAQCMQQHGIVKYSSCGSLSMDEFGCNAAPECEWFAKSDSSETSSCEPKSCEDRQMIVDKEAIRKDGKDPHEKQNRRNCEHLNDCTYYTPRSKQGKPTCKVNTGWF